jgi:hypothetical protein
MALGWIESYETCVGVTKSPGGRRNPLKRLNSAKEMEGFDLDFVAPDLEFVAPGLDFVARNLDFLPRPGASASCLARRGLTMIGQS